MLDKMQTDAIISALLSAAAFLKKSINDVATQSLRDAYDTAKDYLRKKFKNGSAGEALELAVQKPDSVARKCLLIEEASAAGLESDAELHALIARLTQLLPDGAEGRQNVRVSGRNHCVQVAAGDIVNTERHVHRSVITPDERHLDGGQKRKLQAIIADLADRLAGEDGRPRFGAVHAMLQRKFAVGAFALIPKEEFKKVLNFLNQQRAIHRAHLRRRSPAAYREDFFRAIHACIEELGWDKARLHHYAADKLGLTRPVHTLRELGSNQLKSLSQMLRRER